MKEQGRKQALSGRAGAQRFGDCSVIKDYDAAWALLCEELRLSFASESIKNAVTTLTAHGTGSFQMAQVMDEFTLEDWPGKQANDLAVAYVALNGENFSEAVTLTLAEYGHEILIRHLEWGRP